MTTSTALFLLYSKTQAAKDVASINYTSPKTPFLGFTVVSFNYDDVSCSFTFEDGSTLVNCATGWEAR